MLIVLKIGGSLFDRSRALLGKIAGESGDVLIVPGGGDFANAVRKVSSSGKLSDDAGHWMAVLAMNQYAYYLADTTGIKLTERVEGRGIRIALPYEILKREDVLPHSWDVTSDTIAAWMASKLKAGLVKATDVDGVFVNGQLAGTIEASRLATLGETCVDRALPGFLISHNMDAFIVNGRCETRVLKAIKGEMTTGTKILGM